MAKFVEGSELNHEIDSLFKNASNELIIVSPFVKLHSRQKDALANKVNDHKFKLRLVFGKNESNKSRSLGLEDFEFFKKFANVEIYYEPRLHAKYYANDEKGILSSMNLYDYSQNHNIEFGIVTASASGLDRLKEKVVGIELDRDAWKYFDSVIARSELVYHNDPVYESNMFGLSKKYIRSDVSVDLLTNELSTTKKVQKVKPKTPAEVKSIKPTQASQNGYCIRTGEHIPFDVARPYTEKAYQSWSRYKNEDFKEKYCHFSGEPSDSATSMKRPILVKNWKAAKKQFKL